jgi:hypothetical protein
MVKKIRDNQLSETITKLCDLLQDSKDETKDIASIGLKTVVLEISPALTTAPAIVKKLITRLINYLRAVRAFKLFLSSTRLSTTVCKQQT